MMASSSFLAPPLPLLSSLRQPQIHPRCASLCPSSLTAALPPPPGSPRCNSCCRCRCRCRSRPSLPIFCFSLNSRAAYASEEERNKKLLESYGLDPSDFLSRSVNEPRRRRRRDQGEEVGKGKHVPLFQESKPPLRTTHKLLQVLGGKACRKKLLSPKGMDVRPMMEVVKGAAFGILQVAGGCPASLRPGRWLDLYSGTGAVGIEAISRGCSEAHFVEMDPWVVSKVLQPNLESTGFSDVSVIHTVRVERFLEQAEQSLDNNRTFDYVSVTPPYTEVDYSVLMDQLAKSPLVGEDCFILVEYPLKTSMADSCGHLIKISDRRFGRTNLVIYGPSWAEKKGKSRKHIQ
ncbi:putative rRNA methyltransferase YlbH [Zingiber officinale]|uniref:putative rRNA methyltransferase YlbH n=1 Tax=Zingiber officinale TaxID=94328 RepID=UPI001C4B003C|nr:putative rRNA methyltransferase YlbH [Zingiber officinale]